MPKPHTVCSKGKKNKQLCNAIETERSIRKSCRFQELNCLVILTITA